MCIRTYKKSPPPPPPPCTRHFGLFFTSAMAEAIWWACVHLSVMIKHFQRNTLKKILNVVPVSSPSSSTAWYTTSRQECAHPTLLHYHGVKLELHVVFFSGCSFEYISQTKSSFIVSKETTMFKTFWFLHIWILG